MENRDRRRVFSGESLRTVAFPLGGIGTGTVGLRGRGALDNWEVFNHPGKGAFLPFTFFALWYQSPEDGARTRILEGRMLPPFETSGGIPPGTMAGLPRFRDAHFHGEYPLARLELADPDVPLTAQLRAWNPMIPLNADDSGIPVALFEWTITNPTDVPFDISLAFSAMNPIGWDGRAWIGGRGAHFFGGNINEPRDTGDAVGLQMGHTTMDPGDPRWGSIAIAAYGRPVVGRQTHWERAGWFDDLEGFWRDFREDGALNPAKDDGPSPGGSTDVGTLWTPHALKPGESVTMSFALAWSFPNLINTWNSEPAVKDARLGNYYTKRFPTAWDAITYVSRERKRLERETFAFHDALHSGTIPEPILDAVSANMSTVRTTTCLRTFDGRLHAFEGCNDRDGCCPMNCTHVWNYAQAVASLYPELERGIRETDFGHNTTRDGNMTFRTLLPLIGERWNHPPAADGQMGTLLRLYREWRISGDTDWLRKMWPSARASLEFAWSPKNPHRWDLDGDGVMDGIQHNTYDIEFAGPNTMTGAWYLAALKAGAEMAEALGEADRAAEYRARAERGAEGYARLFNGEYFTQDVRFDAATQKGMLTGRADVDDGVPRYQYGPGCLSDQLVGQWFAHCVGLGYVLPAAQVRSAMLAVYRHNFWGNLSAHESCQRTYALNEEAGLVLCSWPNGGRPNYPFPYADEVWTGIEYHVAAGLIFEGLLEQALTIVRAVRARHDGVRRNPWDEPECGHHYARAMSSWSLLTAWSGYTWDGRSGTIGFAPVVSGDFRCFFVTNTGWGIYTREEDSHTLKVLWGEVNLGKWKGVSGIASLNGRPVEAEGREDGLVFAPEIGVPAGSVLRVNIQ